MLRGDGIVKQPGRPANTSREDLKSSGQTDNYATCPEEERGTDRCIYKEQRRRRRGKERARHTALMHFNGIYIKAWQMSRRYLMFGAIKSHLESGLIVKIDESSAQWSTREHTMTKPYRRFPGQCESC